MEYRNLPELSQWAALRAVVERGGVCEAAHTLNIGQPAVSKRLQALEDCYGLPLMERVAGKLRLTLAGERVYALAVQTLDRQFALWEDLQLLAKGSNTLRLEVTSAIGEHLLPDILIRFSERHPEYKVSSRMGYSRRIQAHLATGMADLALVETAPDHPDVLVQKWIDDELMLVCGRRHPLAGVEQIPLEHLGELAYVLREGRSGQRDTLTQALHGVGINELNVVLEVGSSQAIVDILERGRYMSFLPRFMIGEPIAKGDLFRVKVTGFRIKRTLWIARHRDNIDHTVAEAFIKMIWETS